MATEQEKLNFYLPVDEAAWVRETCETEQRSITGYMRLLIRRDRASRETTPSKEASAA
jgi:hypothetical protein